MANKYCILYIVLYIVIGQSQLNVLRDVIVQTFLFVIRAVSRVLQVGAKIT